MIDEVDGRTFRATPTGPFFLADLDNPEAALVQLTSYFRPRYMLDGDAPTIDASVPEGAMSSIPVSTTVSLSPGEANPSSGLLRSCESKPPTRRCVSTA